MNALLLESFINGRKGRISLPCMGAVMRLSYLLKCPVMEQLLRWSSTYECFIKRKLQMKGFYELQREGLLIHRRS